MLSVTMIAEYFLWLTRDQDEQISNLKLQKLLYYAQGYHLANYGVPLFNAPIHAWEHGPVVQEIYHKYKKYGKGGIPALESIRKQHYKDHEKKTIEWVFETFGKFSGIELRNMTHNEPLWQNTQNGQVIQPAQIREYFMTRADIEPRIIFAHLRSWEQITQNLLTKHRGLWERLAQA